METKDNKEIDLLNLFSNIGTSLSKFFLSIVLSFYLLLRKHYIIFIGSLLLGGGVSFYQINNNSTSRVIIASFKSKITNNKEVVKLFNCFEKQLSSGNYNLLSEQLKLDTSIIKSLTSFKISSDIINEDEIGTIEQMKDKKKDEIIFPKYIYTIEIGILRNFQYKQLQKGLEYYVEHNNYIAGLFKAENSSFQGKIDKLKSELNQLDAYQKKILSDDKIRSINIINDKVMISSNETFEIKILKISDEIIELEKEETLNKPITFFTDFYETKVSKTKATFFNIIYFFLITFFIVIGYEILRKLNKLAKISLAK